MVPEHPLQADYQSALSNRAPCSVLPDPAGLGKSGGGATSWRVLSPRHFSSSHGGFEDTDHRPSEPAGPSGQIKQTLEGQKPCRGARVARPGLPQSCGSPRGQQGPRAVLGRGRARTG